MRAMDEIAPGIRHWKATHPNLGIEVSAYWLPELRLLLDPIAVPDEVEGVEHILLSCRHHVRDSLEAAERFGATVRAPRTGMHEFAGRHADPSPTTSASRGRRRGDAPTRSAA